MVKVAQLGIAIGLLGMVIFLMGLYPGMMGVSPTPGIGVIQILMFILGFTMFILGALMYVKFYFYAYKELILMQQIAIRLALTGITFATLFLLADILGFGSNLRNSGEEILIGPIQMIAVLGSCGVSTLGVLLFALAGEPEIIEDES